MNFEGKSLGSRKVNDEFSIIESNSMPMYGFPASENFSSKKNHFWNFSTFDKEFKKVSSQINILQCGNYYGYSSRRGYVFSEKKIKIWPTNLENHFTQWYINAEKWW